MSDAATPFEIRVPPFSSLTVVMGRWLAADGWEVTAEQPICEIETDKASVELTADRAGRLERVAVEGEELKMLGLIGRVWCNARKP